MRRVKQYHRRSSFIGFNFIVFTTNLLLADYAVAVSSFMLATVAALVVGKAVLVANVMPYLDAMSRSADRADTVQDGLLLGGRVLPAFSSVSCTFRSRAIRLGDFIPYLITTFSWHRFSAISLWILVLFLIYVTASEFSHLFGPGELRRLFFTSRPSELQLNRRQRIRELLRLSRLMDAHSIGEFRDGDKPGAPRVIDLLQPLARK